MPVAVQGMAMLELLLDRRSIEPLYNAAEPDGNAAPADRGGDRDDGPRVRRTPSGRLRSMVLHCITIVYHLGW